MDGMLSQDEINALLSGMIGAEEPASEASPSVEDEFIDENLLTDVEKDAVGEVANITGIVLTKLDGTAKGGIVLAIKEAVNIPVKFIGLGEKSEDLRTFDIEKYIYGLFKDM